uniref:HMA domain-containing protein n=1 Tax=Oryza glumipatula TaxID=40148 RepID=A0A0D9YU69_9ORYZ
MKKEIIIRISVKTDKCQKKAMKEAATVSGVQSVTLAGGDRNLLLVIGEGVDTNKLTKKLKRKVGSGEIVELRTVDTFEAAAAMFPGGMIMPPAAPGSKDAAAARAMATTRASPYHYQPSPYGPYHQQQQWQPPYAMAPSPYAYPYQYHPSPMAMAGGGGGYGYGGSSYSRAVALSHPAIYSPLVEKHDYHPMNHSTTTKKKTTTTTTTTGAGTGRAAAADAGGKTFKAVSRSRRHHESDSNACCIL